MKGKFGGLLRSLKVKMGGGHSRQDTRKRPAGAPASETNDDRVKAESPKHRRRPSSQSQTHVSPAVSRSAATRKEIAYVELLKRPGQTLGLIVSGGSDKEQPVRVGGLRQGSIAERSESLEVGDRILAINGKSTDNLTHADVISLLKNAEDVVTLEVEYETSADGPSQDEGVTSKTVLVCLKKEGTTFGFTFSGGVEKGRPLTISNVRPGTAAYRNGTLRPGDRILKVNGMDLRHAAHAEVVALLKTAKRKITLELEYDVTLHESLDEMRGPILVEVQKPVGGSLGLTLTGNQMPGESIFISHIKDAGVADRCGALHVGDQVLSINGQPLLQCSLPDAVQMLINSDTSLKLEVLPVSQLPPGIFPPIDFDDSHERRESDFAPPTSQLHQRRPSVTSLVGPQTPSQGLSRRPSVSSRHGSLLALANPMHLCHTEQLPVQLIPDSYGYGFTMEGINEPSVGPFAVVSIESNSPAQQHGEFMIGDRILSMNGRYTEGMPLEQAWSIVSEATGSLALETEFDVAESVIPGSGTFDVKLAKHGGALGITINGSPERSGPVWISQIKKGGVAHRTGTLEPGDVLLAINGRSLEGATLQHAVDLLKSTGDVVTLRISKDAATLGPPGSVVFAVELGRHGASLGITVHGSENPGDPIIVSHLKEDGVAYRSGTLKVGDRILAINNTNLRMHTLVDAVRLLQTAGDIVTLKICREPTIAPNRFAESLPADPNIYSPKRAYSQGDLSAFTWPPYEQQGDLESEVFYPGVQTLPRSAATPDRAMERRLAMLALKRSGHSTPDFQSVTDSPGFDELYQTMLQSKSEVADESYVHSETDQSKHMHSHPMHSHPMHSHPMHSHPMHSHPSTSDRHWFSTLPRQRTEWVGPKSTSRNYNIRDGYATWHGRKKAATGLKTGSRDLDEEERGFGELRPLDPALGELSRRRKVAQKETSSDSDSPPVNSRMRDRRKSPPKFHQQFDEQLKAAASKPTAVLAKKVILRRKSSLSDFGFSVADGATDSGVYIKAVKPGGPAIDKLKPFDKILQVNDTNVHDSDCCRVVPLIAQASHTLTLIITRRKQPKPAVRKDSDS